MGLFVYGSQGGLGQVPHGAADARRRGRVAGPREQPHHAAGSLRTPLLTTASGKVIFFDDVDSIFGSMAHLGLLQSRSLGRSQDRHLRVKPAG